MKPQDIEIWAISVIKRVEAGQPVEDSRVELKAQWPTDHYRAARRIAGHANSAHGEPILWLIGVDEQKGVIGADYTEISNWVSAIESKFDALAPILHHLNVPHEGQTVVALVYETDRAPYLVKNPMYGKPKSGPIFLEVPCRRAGATRSANRTELLQILYPKTKEPLLEVLNGFVTLSDTRKTTPNKWRINLSMPIYFVPQDDAQIVIPYHKCSITISFQPLQKEVDMSTRFYNRLSSTTIDCTQTEIILQGPGCVNLETAETIEAGFIGPGQSDRVVVDFKFTPTGFSTQMTLQVPFKRFREKLTGGQKAMWVLDKSQ